MQREISNEVKIGDSVTPLKSVGKFPVIDKTDSDFGNPNLKAKKISNPYNDDNELLRTDDNLEDCGNKFRAKIHSKYVCRIPLKYFCDLCKLNFPTKTDLKIRRTPQTEMKKLIESKTKVNAIGSPSPQICQSIIHLILKDFAHEKFQTISQNNKIVF